MAKRELPSPEMLRQLLRYEPETGKLFWKERGIEWFKDGSKSAAHNCAVWNSRYADQEAMIAISSNGYRVGAIMDHKYLAHRIIMAMQFGEWPTQEVDHINRDKLDNRLQNLRLASRSENARNTRAHNDSASGLKGVMWHPSRSKWRAKIMVHGKAVCLGLFATRHQAFDAYCRASAELHGDFGSVK